MATVSHDPAGACDVNIGKEISMINAEMKQKLEELHCLMKQKGMRQSTVVIDQCAATLEINSKARRNNGEEILNLNANTMVGDNKKTRKIGGAGGAINKSAVIRENANVNFNLGSESRSVETIYENAVPRRGSSSSEEENNLNSSDDMADTQEHLNNLILEGCLRAAQLPEDGGWTRDEEPLPFYISWTHD